MVKAWYMDNETTDQRLENHRNPPEFVSVEELYKKTGVEYFRLNMSTYTTDSVLEKITKERGYSYEDEIVHDASKNLPNYEKKLKSFYTEHLHLDEQIKFVVNGSGYFDVRDRSDQWIRIALSAGDMIVLPSSTYHRFSLDKNNFIRMKRFFLVEQVWPPHIRSGDQQSTSENTSKPSRRPVDSLDSLGRNEKGLTLNYIVSKYLSYAHY